MYQTRILIGPKNKQEEIGDGIIGNSRICERMA